MLSNATKTETGGDPIIMTLCGDAGTGKTSVATTFPKPFIIRTQGENVPRDAAQKPDGLPPVGSKQTDQRIWDEGELFDQLKALLTEDHEYKTLIIDSVTGLEGLFVSNIIAVQPDKQKTMNAAGRGFASEWDTVAAKHGRIKKAAELLRDRKGMHVIFICHVDVDRIDLPDADSFNRYTLQLNKKTAPIYTNNVDVVGFLKQETFVTGDEGQKKARTSGNRVMVVTMSPSNISKNRLGIDVDLVVEKGVNPLEEYI